jgi:hypothetical protein
MSSIDFSGPEIRQAFFIVSPTVKGTYVCKECEATIKSANGCTNLVTHVSGHEGWQQKLIDARKEGRPLDSFVKKLVSAKASNLFGWIQQCVFNDLPFTYVENQYVKKFSKLTPICRKTMIKYMEAIRDKVELQIKSKLTDENGNRRKVGLIFDCKYNIYLQYRYFNKYVFYNCSLDLF